MSNAYMLLAQFWGGGGVAGDRAGLLRSMYTTLRQRCKATFQFLKGITLFIELTSKYVILINLIEFLVVK